MKKNNIPFETLRPSYKKPIIIGIVVFVVIMSALVLKGTRANYQLKQSIPFVKGTINYTMPDIQVAELYVDDVRVTNLEENEKYELDTTSSYCTYKEEKIDVTITYDTDNNKLIVNPLDNKGTKCYLYFKSEVPSAGSTIIAGKDIQTRTDFSAVLTDDTTGIIYSAEDDDGTTYYFAGAPTDNYVYFAGFYWRIIRVNGDGSIRMIYSGTTPVANGTADTTNYYQRTGTSAFNSTRTDNMYVGFMYTSGSVHGLGTSSTIKGVLDTWYSSNLASYASYIDTNAGFCGDRQPFTDSAGTTEGGGTGTTTTYYAAYIRLITNKAPSFKCQTSTDLYTISSSTKGNKALTNPIGIITADEVAYAGGVYSTFNASYYLYTGFVYWTMSPYWLSASGYANTFLVDSGGALNPTYVHNTNGVRPVINLRSDVTITGSGTSSDPYLIS